MEIECNFSKLGVQLHSLDISNKDDRFVYLSLNPDEPANTLELINKVNYSNTIKLSNDEYICYQLLNDYKTVAIYALGGVSGGKTVIITLPEASLNQWHTFTVREIQQEVSMDLILERGIFLNMKFHVDCILSKTRPLQDDWFRIFNPYDFTVRKPHLLLSVSDTYSVVFLEDGGLVGLTKVGAGDSQDIHPVLFNDNSYLQSFTKLFSRKEHFTQSVVVSCVLYKDQYLITLTQNCRMKVWDLSTQAVVYEQNFLNEGKGHMRVYEVVGRFLCIYKDVLVAFLPLGNGLFQFMSLGVDQDSRFYANSRVSISPNLSASFIWSLVDMKLNPSYDTTPPSNSMDLIVMWKSNRTAKLQTSKVDMALKEARPWSEPINRSITDLQTDLDLLTDGDTTKALLNLKSHYAPSLFAMAQRMLSENGMLISPNSQHTQEYLIALETVLKDLKKHNDEPTSLMLYQQGLVVVNCLGLFSHALYRTHTDAEQLYYRLGFSSSQEVTNDLEKYLRVVHGFSRTLSTSLLAKVSDALAEVVSTNSVGEGPLKEGLARIFVDHLDRQFEMANLKKLFEELNDLDVVNALKGFIKKYLELPIAPDTLINAIKSDNFIKVSIIEGIHQIILAQHQFTLEILLTFAFMDFEYKIIHEPLQTLLTMHYKQCLWVKLYRLNKGFLAAELLKRVTKLGHGAKFVSYEDLQNLLDVILTEFYEMPVSPNGLFIEFFDRYIVSGEVGKPEAELFLSTVQRTLYIKGNAAHEFMMALSLFMCGHYGTSFEFFQKHNYPDCLPKELPDTLFVPLQKDSHLWREVIQSFKLKYKQSAYFYHLSKMYSRAGSFDYALRCIKKSIKLSTDFDDLGEPMSYKILQLCQYVDMLVIFEDLNEVVSVLKCSPDILDEKLRGSYYETLLSSAHHRDRFFGTILDCCVRAGDKLFLPFADFCIIDHLLKNQCKPGDWIAFKKLFSFRFANLHDRKAAEAMYEFIRSSADVELKERAYLIILNILNSLAKVEDRWILSEGGLVTAATLQSEREILLH
ncbi:LAMI_0D01354g1_1 [Lachancea mirantina]|uniref:LAMI_0D01354g1_1 n=1 Tax=Lachancea mirantina TaxID=1230905 RepID=A0A1G4J8J3_9SACH|nr:LAMI_0D01354g1_1 [Lachancea mirantina]